MEIFKAGKNNVTFKSNEYQLAGHLYLPIGFDASKKYPTIIYSGPMTQIKEQVGAIYGRKLAAKGFVTLAFDHVGFGESEGRIRNYENPNYKMENIRDAISFLRTLSLVDRDKLYALGICASGATMAMVTMTDKRIKAFATISGYMDQTQAFYNNTPREQVVDLMTMANETRQNAYETGELDYMDVMGMDNLELDGLDEHNVMRNAYDYYMTERGGVKTYPRYEYKNPALFFEIYPQNNSIPFARYLYTPYLGLYGENALQDTAPLTLEFYNEASEPKELFEIKGASHVDLYDKDEYVDQAIDRLIIFTINIDNKFLTVFLR